MARSPRVSNEDIIGALHDGPKTAAQLGVSTSRMRSLEGGGVVVQSGSFQTGARGRPALLFTLA